MKIQIDTQTDSHEHIRKVIDLLRQVIGESSSSASQPSASPFADIFGDASQSSAPAPAAPDPASTPPAPSLDQLQQLNAPQPAPQAVDIWGNPKKPDDDVKLETY